MNNSHFYDQSINEADSLAGIYFQIIPIKKECLASSDIRQKFWNSKEIEKPKETTLHSIKRRI